MTKIIAASINLSKIDKSKIVPGKAGAKYYNISIIVTDEKDEYGNDTSITEGQTKEERAAKTQRVFIGNGKTVWTGENKTTNSTNTNDDLPF